MNRQDFRFFDHLRVRWAEVDMQKIVFNAHYLMYFDTAVTGYWRALAMPYAEAMELFGGDLYVRKASIEFHASARWDDRLDIGMRCSRVGNSSITIAGAIFRGDQLLITGELVYVFADPSTQTSRPVPQALRQLLEDFEASKPMLDVQTGDWALLGQQAAAIRTEVFVKEQGISSEDEWDGADTTAVHALVRNHLGQPLGTGRLLQESPGVARIGRMAVLQALRGAGVGQAVMAALEQAAKARGDRELVLGAQCSAEPFYQRLGYTRRGEQYDDVGIPHVHMGRTLS
ncbi:YbgC/FadM family acyl-CoA thioesterase [Ottowia thiooxydans]|uniref:YbgC/FadM family acyl-CoA thioesterase n=1 Tax=Ottowia thiooxydans TaxID=219182 RepID=UPI0003F8E4F5|nr:YbgC/FadM family acyl-CoA thioesterase [Ottowia thiooxydans]